MYEEDYEHESYGVVSINRVDGAKQLFCSDVINNSYISLEINEAVLSENSITDRKARKRKMVCRVEMSHSQFAQAITSLNNGEGVPCTINMFNEKRMEQPPAIHSQFEQIKGDFSKDLSKVRSQIDDSVNEIEDLISSKKVSKKVGSNLQRLLTKINYALGDNSEFLVERFQENTQELLTQAKQEFEAYVDSTLYRRGLTEVDRPQLLNKKE